MLVCAFMWVPVCAFHVFVNKANHLQKILVSSISPCYQ